MNASLPKLRDPDLLKVGDALHRAAQKAQKPARRTGTPCYVWQDGCVVNIGAPVRAEPVRAEPLRATFDT